MKQQKEIFLLVIKSLFFLLLLTGCQPKSNEIEPKMTVTLTPRQLQELPSAFPELTSDELQYDWARELIIANGFANEMDLYRAITGYKRALYLLPKEEKNRREHLHFNIFECYYLGHKYDSAIEQFENSDLFMVKSDFPAYRELLILIADTYQRLGKKEAMGHILAMIDENDKETAELMRIGKAVEEGKISELEAISKAETDSQPTYIEDVNCLLSNYEKQAKSPRTAQLLNAVFPGAGYFYVDQKNTAITSLLLNASFIYTTYYFYDSGNYGAAAIAGSLEMGWYLGGINGAGIAAKEFNEHIYRQSAAPVLQTNKMVPSLMLRKSF